MATTDKDKEDIIIQKLLSSIPSQYYYRLTSPETKTLEQLLQELEKIEALTEALESVQDKNSNKFQDPALRVIMTEEGTRDFRNNERKTAEETIGKDTYNNKPIRDTKKNNGYVTEGMERHEGNTTSTYSRNIDQYSFGTRQRPTAPKYTFNNTGPQGREINRFNRYNSWSCRSCNTPNDFFF